MEVSELHQYVSQLREYIVTLERRVKQLEEQVNPPETVDLGNGRMGFTRHGVRKMLDRISEQNRQERLNKR